MFILDWVLLHHATGVFSCVRRKSCTLFETIHNIKYDIFCSKLYLPETHICAYIMTVKTMAVRVEPLYVGAGHIKSRLTPLKGLIVKLDNVRVIDVKSHHSYDQRKIDRR